MLRVELVSCLEYGFTYVACHKQILLDIDAFLDEHNHFMSDALCLHLLDPRKLPACKLVQGGKQCRQMLSQMGSIGQMYCMQQLWTDGNQC